jgi:hypothetical protein
VCGELNTVCGSARNCWACDRLQQVAHPACAGALAAIFRLQAADSGSLEIKSGAHTVLASWQSIGAACFACGAEMRLSTEEPPWLCCSSCPFRVVTRRPPAWLVGEGTAPRWMFRLPYRLDDAAGESTMLEERAWWWLIRELASEPRSDPRAQATPPALSR